MYLKLAWRNIWRNKWRTLITASSIFTAVILSMVMRSAQLGIYGRMISDMVSIYTGHVEIHKKGYNDNQTIDNSFIKNDSISAVLNKSEAIAGWAPRLEGFALASSDQQSKGVSVVGIDPTAENKLTHLSSKIVSGNYLSDNDHEILVSEGAADYLKLHIKDTVVLMGQGFHGMTAAGKYAVKGIVKFPVPQFNQGMVFLSLSQAQSLYGTSDKLTSIAVILKDGYDVSDVSAQLGKEINASEFEVLDWKTLLPELVQTISADNSSGIIIISVLYLIIAFGMFSTTLMMITERMHEFGILIAIGMKKAQLAWMVVLEMFMISTVGIFAGAIIGQPILYYLHLHPLPVSGATAQSYAKFGMEPIFPFSDSLSILLHQSAVIYCISLLLTLYPLLRLLKLKTMEALNS